MKGFPSHEIVERLRAEYPPGTRVMLESMIDPYSKLEPGDRGTVEYVDDAGSIGVRWDKGSGLSLIYGEDEYRKLTQEEIMEEQNEQENEPEQDEGPVMGM